MKTQLLREHHSRQDKTRKPDYREEIVERGRSEQTTTESSRLLGRVSARENLVQSIRSFRFVYRGMSYKFGWNLEIFARKNDLPAGDDTTKAAMEMVQQAAERDVSAFAERIMTAAIRKQGVFYHFDYEAPKTECQML